jgi:flagellar M-ring protein FliF
MYELFQRMVDTVKRMPPNLRFMIVISTVLVVAGTVLIYSWAQHMTYGVLYADLPAEEVGAIVDQLEQMKIPYRLSGGGATVSIEESKIGEARVRLASAGLPSGGAMGYEIFDKSTMGMTEFVQKLNFRRALEGELTRTISSLSEVASARVHIVMPEQKLFVEDEIAPTASVVVKLRAGARLDPRKVNGIQQLVASGVEGLHAENVTILDYAGNLLSPAASGDPVAMLSARQLDLQKSVESYLQNKAQSLLDGVIGPGRSLVRVNAKLNFEQVEKTVEEYDPDNLAIVSQERNEETTSDNSATAEGGNAGSQVKKENTITNYEVNKTVQRIIAETGNIEKLTLSVIVDGKYGPPAEEGGEPAFTPRSTEEISQLSGALKNAVGYDDNRHDSFEMVSVQFDRDYFKDEQSELDKLEQRNFFMDIGMKALKVIGLVIAFLFIRKMWKKIVSAVKAWVPPPPPPPKPAPVQRIEDEPAEPIMPEKRKPKLTDQMSEVAKERPEEIAKVIRTMMIE